MLRFHLPPNLVAAAGRDAVPLRVDLDLATPPASELLPVLALLQRWCGTAAPPRFIQLTRAQLRDLAAAAGEQPLFIENGQSTPWLHPDLVSDPPVPRPSTSSLAAPVAPSVPRRAGSTAPPSTATPLTVDGSEHFLALTLPSREHPRYADALALVKEIGFVLEPSNRKWWLRDRHKTLNFLATHGARLRGTFGADFTPNFEKNTTHLRTAKIAAEVTESAGEFSVDLGLRAGSADEATLRSALATNRGYLEADGKIFLLDAARIEKLAQAQRALAGDPKAPVTPRRSHRVSAARAAETQEVLEELSPNFQAPESWRTRAAALHNLSALAPAPLPEALNAQLRPYQRLGVAWLCHLYRHDLAGILADEMGLGKTLQALGLLSAIQVGFKNLDLSAPARPTVAPNPGPLAAAAAPLATRPAPLALPRGTSLVVAPASLLENWRREAARFAPQLRVFVHHADCRLAAGTEFAAHDVIITSYGTLARDQALFASVEFSCVIADEAQHIKNRRSQNAAALRALRARARFLLTGTPLENSLDDLRSLFEFLLPGYVTRVPAGLRGDERGWFDDRLRAQTAPYILRRTKKAVAPELPEKLEQIIWCELTPTQARLYRDTQEKSERELFDLAAGGANEAKLKFAALTQLLRLRQICCDPRLVPAGRGAPAEPSPHPGVNVADIAQSAPAVQNPFWLSVDASPYPEHPASGTIVPPPPPSFLAVAAAPTEGFADSAKLDAFRELLAEVIDDGHRLLVFSQFTSLLALLRVELDAQEILHCYLDGSMSARARQAEVDRFQSSAEVPLFLLSLKAGGTGLNLTGADTVVHFDPWWNPAAEAQATDRAHRIGQSRVVTSYKLIAAGTVEEKVLALQAEKRALLAGVFEASDIAAAKLTLADLKALLK